MAYIRLSDNYYPLSDRDIRETFPNTSFAEPFSPPEGYAWVFPSPRPNYNSITHYIRETSPTQNVLSQWVQVWEVIAFDNEITTINISKLKTSKIEAIKSLRDHKTQTGGFPAAGKWFHSDTLSRTQQLGLVLLGSNMPTGIMWKTMDGTFIEMTSTLAGQIFSAAAAQDAAIFAHAETLISQINAAADPTTIDINLGWPATYG